jgi:hypothetical protein
MTNERLVLATGRYNIRILTRRNADDRQHRVGPGREGNQTRFCIKGPKDISVHVEEIYEP